MRYRLILAMLAAGAFLLPGWSHAGVRVNVAQKASRGHFRASLSESLDLRTGNKSQVVDLFDELPGSVPVRIRLERSVPTGIQSDMERQLRTLHRNIEAVKAQGVGQFQRLEDIKAAVAPAVQVRK